MLSQKLHPRPDSINDNNALQPQFTSSRLYSLISS